MDPVGSGRGRRSTYGGAGAGEDGGSGGGDGFLLDDLLGVVVVFVEREKGDIFPCDIANRADQGAMFSDMGSDAGEVESMGAFRCVNRHPLPCFYTLHTYPTPIPGEAESVLEDGEGGARRRWVRPEFLLRVRIRVRVRSRLVVRKGTAA